MTMTSTNATVYESITKYKESLIQCPLCQYYFKVNPQTDTMKYRLLTKNNIQFMTQHSFNSSIHTVIIEYVDFSFSKIIETKQEKSETTSITSNNFFQLFHMVNLNEYKTFRDRVLELECNNNDLITNFKAKLEILELNYNKKNDELLLLDQTKNIMNVQNSLLEHELNYLRNEFLASIQQEIESLKTKNTSLLNELNSTKAKLATNEEINYKKKLETLQIQIQNLEKSLEDSKERNNVLTNELVNIKEKQAKYESKENIEPNQKLLDIFDTERRQKRIAVREKKELEDRYQDLECRFNAIEQNVKTDLTTKTQQVIHELTLEYEKKISDLTLLLADKEEQIKLIAKGNESILKETKFDKQFRSLISNEFVSLQNQFNEFQYDIMLSFYNTEKLNPQIRNAVEQFFGQLILKTNQAGSILLNDPEFSLFKERKEIKTRLKFSYEQFEAAMNIRAINIVFSDLCKYIFAIIKSIKANVE